MNPTISTDITLHFRLIPWKWGTGTGKYNKRNPFSPDIPSNNIIRGDTCFITTSYIAFMERYGQCPHCIGNNIIYLLKYLHYISCIWKNYMWLGKRIKIVFTFKSEYRAVLAYFRCCVLTGIRVAHWTPMKMSSTSFFLLSFIMHCKDNFDKFS